MERRELLALAGIATQVTRMLSPVTDLLIHVPQDGDVPDWASMRA